MDARICNGTGGRRITGVMLFFICLAFVLLGTVGLFPGAAAAGVSASPGSLNFYTCSVGSEKVGTVYISYVKDAATDPDSKVISLRLSGDSAFALKGSSSFTIPAGGTVSARISFTPELEKDYAAVLTGGGINVSISGSGYFTVNDVIDIRSGASIVFGPCAVGTEKTFLLRLVNTGGVDVKILKTIPDLSSPADGSAVFTITDTSGNKLTGQTIRKYEEFEAIVTFAPKAVKQYIANVQILYDNFVKSSEISLSGSGIQFSGQIITVAGWLDFGNCNIGREKNATLLFSNNSSFPVTVKKVEITPETIFQVPDLEDKTIPPHGVLDVMVTFAPESVGDISGQLRVLYDSWLPESIIDMRGNGTANPEISLAPAAVDFGTVGLDHAASRTLVLTNTGDVDVEILQVNTSSEVFQVSGLSGTLEVGKTLTGTVTFTPSFNGVADGSIELVFDNLPSRKIPLSGTGAQIVVNPSEVAFAGLNVGESQTREIMVTNCSKTDLQVKGATTGTGNFGVTGLDPGTIIPANGGTLKCLVTFSPKTSGYFADNLFFNIGKVEEASIPEQYTDWGVQYIVHLSGVPYVNYTLTEFNTFTADTGYHWIVSAATPNPGRLYVLMAHDPLSAGVIYAVTADGSIRPFPYQSPDGWQNLWYQPSSGPLNILDLSWIDLRQLGCTQCQGPGGGTAQTFMFGGIPIEIPPAPKVYNNASDFKFMPGVLYTATFVKDPGENHGIPFRFDQGLLEFQALKIYPLAGTWRVTSHYMGVDRVHANALTVTENNGQISAVWPPYPVVAHYNRQGPGYILEFSMGAYHYVYKIEKVTKYGFTGSYSCYYQDQVVEQDSPVKGERLSQVGF